MEGAADFTPFQEQVQAALISSTKTTGQIIAEDLAFHRSLDSNVTKSLDEQGNRLLNLTNSLLRIASSNNPDSPFSSNSRTKSARRPVLRDEESIDENWKSVVDVIDELLEKADACLDEFTGIIKKLSPSQQERQREKEKEKDEGKQGFPSMYSYGPSKIPKPQLLFDVPLNNADDGTAFKPLLKTKPHAIVPFEKSLGGSLSDPTKPYNHPYSQEIAEFTYPESVYKSAEPMMYQPVETTKATFVDTLEGVHAMLAELKKAKEIAVDLEHHDSHVYHGIVCLMQISTREQDWIVDTLKPWRAELQVLNEVFADPSIVKVLHGSSMDVIWLQRDLGLYLVGLFDTYHASCALQLQKKSLKFLLREYVGFDADKKYQTADWRIRPLLPGMLDYARSDTHFLLYIFDRLRNDLIAASEEAAGGTAEDGIEYVLSRSKECALQRYERPTYDSVRGRGSGGWHDMLSNSPVLFTREQFAVFRALHEWRDRTSRADDESTQTVLSKRSLFRIAQEMPEDKFAVLRFASPVSASLRSRAEEVAALIGEAKKNGATGPEMHEMIRRRSPAAQAARAAAAAAASPASPAAKVVAVEDGMDLDVNDAGVDAGVGVRTSVSQFWGQVEDTEHPQYSNYAIPASAQALQLSLPLPSMPVRVVEDNMPSASSGLDIDEDEDEDDDDDDDDMENEEEEEARPKTVKSNEIFTVKQFGVPQKRQGGAQLRSDDDETAPADPGRGFDMAASEILLDDTSADRKQKKGRRQKQKQRSSLGKRRREDGNEEDAMPFDYANAESLIHAKADDGQDQGKQGGKGKGRRFDPYVKLSNAPSGVKKVRKETAGRSHTFR
ncbi:exosome component 3'-5' exonuclease [Arthroderma uncinatum]|uniref:exosome component 3'-5' exonuclease n=1 Tax=Arthroderma uncinatum TaxID=74035 RepID=UPI00144A86A0|nr:exosome component 3'-5' exonuclease [Arthroderma uncinatum]KAF3490972.1 exosome component 3'-5' exonuclease [Arthroderma uncinatum]